MCYIRPAVGIWSLLFLALGTALFIEGLPYFVSPPAVRRYLATLSMLNDATLRSMGLALMLLGLIVAYAATR